jgi:hypothetical protein
MAKSVSILCVHGIGHGDADLNLRPSWTAAIQKGLRNWNSDVTPELKFLAYDKLFEDARLDAKVYAAAMAKLLASAVVHSVGDIFTRERSMVDFPEQVRWTAGMIAQWAADEDLRRHVRDVILAELKAKHYDAVCAHSLGSLICYDTFKRSPKALEGTIFVSLGSQIGNPAVRDVFAGRIEPLEAVTWYHLFNSNDHVFTTDLSIPADNFVEVATDFDIPNDVLNHDGAHYLGHANTVASVWRELSGVRAPRALTASLDTFAKLSRKPTRRALLIGINDYPDPRNRLEGCVNDVFLMSSLLQEATFDSEDIRVVLNERATASGILDRLHWLLDDVKPGDERVLFYSGHGAQLPAYGVRDEPDHMSECLVPYDFDWTPERAIRDKQFKEFYSQLPYESYFLAVFDCCHSGGMSRDGGNRVRGLNAPDDIRHRALRWNAERQMWEERAFRPPNDTLAASGKREAYLGKNGATYRLGRAIALRGLPNAEYNKTRRALGHHGPFMPIILEACRENELSYEYKHGVTSYGAFTYSVGVVLRAKRAVGRNMTFAELAAAATEQLEALHYEQTPCLVGPKDVIAQPIPWYKAGSRGTPARRRRARSKRPAQ